MGLVWNIYYDFKNIYKSRFIFLPNNFNKSIDNFINIIEQKYVDYYWLGGKMERFDLEEAGKIFYVYHEIFDSFRKFLGIKTFKKIKN